MGLTVNLQKYEQRFRNITELSPGQCAVLLGNRCTVYCAKEGLVVSLINPREFWEFPRGPADNYRRVTCTPTVFDAVILSMPVSLFTNSFVLRPIKDMKLGDFGIIADQSDWHGAMIFRSAAGVIHLSKVGSRFIRTCREGKVQLVNIELRERSTLFFGERECASVEGREND